MAGSPLATNARIMRLRTPFLVLVLLLLSGQLYATEQSAGADEAASGTPPPVRMIKPTRESIYAHLMTEMEAALGAEEHIKGVFSRLADGLQTALSATVIPSLQAMVDTVLQKAEDTWVTADDAGKASAVRPCVDGAENDAQQVAKRALEKAEGCIRSLEDEGQRRIRQAARLLNEIEDVSKRFVTALETCVKEEEAKEAAQPPADDSASASVPAEPEPAKASGDQDTEVAVTEGPGKCLKASSDAADASGEKPARCPHSKGEDAANAAQEEAATGEGPGSGQKKKPCAKCKKAQEDAARKATAGDASQEEANTPEETEHVESAEEKEGKYGKENKGKKRKEWKDNKGKDESGKGKREDSANVDETVNGKGSEKSKEKGKDKNKKGKDGEAKAGKESEKAEKKSKGFENEETTSTEETSGETKGKKGKKQDKKEGKVKKEKGGESSESKKSRKKRDLLAVNEKPDAAPQPSSNSAATNSQEAPSSEGSPASAPSEDPWPTEGATPEERRVIACMRSATLQPLLEEKTRVYQRLQGVLQRTAEKEQEAPTCVDEHVHKAELKIAAIKQRMGSCADRKMRQEL